MPFAFALHDNILVATNAETPARPGDCEVIEHLITERPGYRNQRLDRKEPRKEEDIRDNINHPRSRTVWNLAFPPGQKRQDNITREYHDKCRINSSDAPQNKAPKRLRPRNQGPIYYVTAQNEKQINSTASHKPQCLCELEKRRLRQKPRPDQV